MIRLDINAGRCKGCALCTVACPKKLLVLGEKMNQYGFTAVEIVPGRESECSGCALCARMCPDVAIIISREEEKG